MSTQQPQPQGDKTKAERLAETIRILKGLQEAGVPVSDAGYQEIQEKMTTWVQTGVADSFKVTFSRVNRRAEVTLPRKANRTAELVLKVVT